MKKFIALLKGCVISFAVYLWFLGSSLLTTIDRREYYRAKMIKSDSEWSSEINYAISHISNVCKLKVVAQKLKLEHESNTNINGETVAKTISNAKREKTIRDNVIYIPELRQLWCLVPKAASTSWSHEIVESLPHIEAKLQRDLRNNSIPIQVALRKQYGNIGTKKYEEIRKSAAFSKVVLARHPFSRIISAFEDKLKDRKAREDSMYFFGHYGVKINRAFRKNRRINKRKEPTFEEFVEYLLQTDPMDYDEHWKPISLLCGLCRINYTHVIKQEDLENRAALKMHLDQLGFAKEMNPLKFHHENFIPRMHNTVVEYFRNISQEKIHQLFRKYEDDFKFFRYNYNFSDNRKRKNNEIEI